MNRYRLPILAAVAAAVALTIALLPGIAFANVPSSEVPDDLEAAIKAKIESEGHQYAGFCEEIDQPANVGKYCAFVLELTDDTATVSYGPVLSEPTAQITFIKVDGAWTHPGGGPGEGEPDPVPADLEDAIEDYIEGKGLPYAGLCDEIAQDGSNIGKYCASVAQFDEDSATVFYGAVASDQAIQVNFVKVGGQWQAQTGSAPQPTQPIPNPPATGSGLDGDDGIDGTVLALLLGGVALTAGAGTLAAASYRRR